MKRRFFFTVDDNIRFLKELSESGADSLFSHPYPAMYRRLHERFALKVQLNLFYECEGFSLADMTDRFAREFGENADWLKLSFHSRLENRCPYEHSDYGEVRRDAEAVHREILRFAEEASLAETTTVHWCRATEEGERALRDLGIRGLLGLYGSDETPRLSYTSGEAEGSLIRAGASVLRQGMAFAGIDLVLNQHELDVITARLAPLIGREFVKVMIHEQYFYPDYTAYQPNFESKLEAAFTYLCENGYESAFFEDALTGNGEKI